MYPNLRRNSPSGPKPTLAEAIAAEIASSGGLPFSAFMEAALYRPGQGYYARERRPWGDGGDYLTAPQVGGALASAVATLALETAARTPGKQPFDLVEFGSGDGALMSAVLGQLAARDVELYRRLRVLCVERSGVARRQLTARLPTPPGGLQVVGDLRERGPAVPLRGLILSNELLDAMPVERIRRQGGRLQRSWIELCEESLVERWREPVAPALIAHLEANGIDVREGQVVEICPSVAGWMKAVAGVLQHGVVLTIDYGHETSTLYGENRMRGTLLCQRRFALSDEPLAAVGDQDITAHVDFGNLRRLGALHGLRRGELCSLRVFLIGTLAAGGAPDLRDPDSSPARLALRHLLVSELADTHRVMLQTRGDGLDGLRFGRQRLERAAAESC